MLMEVFKFFAKQEYLKLSGVHGENQTWSCITKQISKFCESSITDRRNSFFSSLLQCMEGGCVRDSVGSEQRFIRLPSQLRGLELQ